MGFGDGKNILIKKDSIVVVQRYRIVRNTHPTGIDDRYKKIKSGKDYWLPLEDNVLVCRRSPKIWGFKHKCPDGTRWYAGKWTEMRKAPRKEFMKCVGCGKKFEAQEKMIAKARSTYPDIDTMKFIAGLAKICGN